MSLQIRDINVSFGRQQVLRNFSIPDIEPGEMISIIGKNGAGKSTLLKEMSKLTKSQSINWAGSKLALEDIGYLPQDHRISACITVIELLITTMHVGMSSLFTKKNSAERALYLLETIGILHLANKCCTQLSGGESQMVGLAQAVINKPKVLVLDEPTAALDMNNQLRLLDYVRRYVREEGACVLMVIHDLNLAIQYSDKVAALHFGKLFVYGEPKRVIDRELIQDVFNVNSQVIQVNDNPVVVVQL